MIIIILRLIIFFILSLGLGYFILYRNYKIFTSSKAIHSLFIGILLNTVLFIVTKIINIHWFFMFTPSTLLIVLYFFYHDRYLPRKYLINYKHLFYYSLGFLFFSLLLIIQGFKMGVGTYPGCFYNIDTPYYLQFVHSFIQNDTYPPISLLNINDAHKYHYGVMALGALVSKFSGVTAHMAFCFIVPVLGNFFLFSYIKINLPNSKNFYLFLLFLLFLLFTVDEMGQQGWNYINRYTRSSGFPLISSLYGLAIGLAVLSYSRKYWFNAGLLMLFFIPIFKIPFAPILLLGFCSVVFIDIFVNRSYKNIKYIIIGPIVMMFSYFIFSQYKGHVETSDVFAYFNFPNLYGTLYYWYTFVIYFMLVIVFLIIRKISVVKIFSEEWRDMINILLFTMPLPILMLFVKLTNPNAYQFSTIFPVFMGVFTATFAIKLYMLSKRRIRIIILFFAISVMIPALLNYGINITRILKDSSRGYQYCNNDAMAEILITLPIEGTVIITNDLRYPAENYKRDGRQFQISAIYGHQSFLTNLHYENSKKRRKKLIELVQSDKWDFEIERMASQYGITHLLVHKNYIYPNDIPLDVLIENRQYILFKF